MVKHWSRSVQNDKHCFTHRRRELENCIRKVTKENKNMNLLKNKVFTPHLCYKEMITVIMPNTITGSKASKIVVKNRC